MPRLAVVFQIGSLGDSIVSLPALRSLRRLVPDFSEYILVDRFDNVTKVLPTEVFEMVMKPLKRLGYRGTEAVSRLGRIRSIASLAAQLRYYRPHSAIYLMPSDRTTLQIERDRAFFRSTGVREFVGFRGIGDDERAEDRCPGKKCSEAYLRLRRLWNGQSEEQFAIHGQVPLLEPTKVADGRVVHWLRAQRRFPGRPLVGVCPFSNFSSKDLSLEATLELVQRLESEAVVEAVIVGGPADISRARSIIEHSSAGLNGCGLFSVGETAALLRKCSMAITIDSGPMHLAAAVGTPTVVVYSRTNSHLDRWFPLGTGHIILYRDVACAGCRQQVCPVSNHPCIDGVSVDEIFGAALHVLRGAALPAIRSGTRVLTL
jgi:ADP-heptose:LPS heptosyltransferase